MVVAHYKLFSTKENLTRNQRKQYTAKKVKKLLHNSAFHKNGKDKQVYYHVIIVLWLYSILGRMIPG